MLCIAGLDASPSLTSASFVQEDVDYEDTDEYQNPGDHIVEGYASWELNPWGYQSEDGELEIRFFAKPGWQLLSY